MTRRKKKRNRRKLRGAPPRKISAMIAEMARDFIACGATFDDRQNRLTAACAAWNMACASPELRLRYLEQYLEALQHNNPMMAAAMEDVRKDIDMLIERKQKLFPHVRRPILDAHLIPLGDTQFHIQVVSAVVP